MSVIVHNEIVKTLRDVVGDFPKVDWEDLPHHLANGYGEGYQNDAAKALIDFDYACAVEIVLLWHKTVCGEVPDYIIDRAADDNLWYGWLMSILFEHLLRESKTYCSHRDDGGYVSHLQMKKIRKEISYYMWDNPDWHIDDMFVTIPGTGKYVLKHF